VKVIMVEVSFRYARNGKSHELGLGSAIGLRAVSLADARKLAGEYAHKLKAKIDPIAEKKAKASAPTPSAAKTFRQCVDDYISIHSREWSNKKHRHEWDKLADAVPSLTDMPIDVIGFRDVEAAIVPIWRRTPETASRIRQRVEAIFEMAIGREFRTTANPATWARLQHSVPKLAKSDTHHAAMPFDDVPAFLAELRGDLSLPSLGLQFTILTAARAGEVIGNLREGNPGVRWQEIDLEARTWTVPANRMKKPAKCTACRSVTLPWPS
jgi:integrase